MNSERRTLFLGILGLLGGGAMLNPLVVAPLADTRNGAWALAGGGQPLAADWFWLQTDLAWERRDAVGTRYLIDLTLAADPQSQYFWLNSARMVAYDLPAWTGEAGNDAAPGMRAHSRKVAAEEALQLLARGLQWHPRSAALQIEMGNICLFALGDRARAAEYYRRAAAQPNAPAYASRICGRLREERR